MSADFADRAEALRERTMAVLRVAFLSSTVLELFSAIGVAMVAVYVGFALLGEIPFGAWATPLTLTRGHLPVDAGARILPAAPRPRRGLA
jgi:ATP-binding cassette subfamily C protein CydD